MVIPLIDLTGKRFGRLKAISYEGLCNGVSYWLCKCDCGKYKKIRANSLQQGVIKSCGCLHKDKMANKSKITSDQANEIKTLYATGLMTQKEIAKKYDVSTTTISHIVRK